VIAAAPLGTGKYPIVSIEMDNQKGEFPFVEPNEVLYRDNEDMKDLFLDIDDENNEELY